MLLVGKKKSDREGVRLQEWRQFQYSTRIDILKWHWSSIYLLSFSPLLYLSLFRSHFCLNSRFFFLAPFCNSNSPAGFATPIRTLCIINESLLRRCGSHRGKILEKVPFFLSQAYQCYEMISLSFLTFLASPLPSLFLSISLFLYQVLENFSPQDVLYTCGIDQNDSSQRNTSKIFNHHPSLFHSRSLLALYVCVKKKKLKEKTSYTLLVAQLFLFPH